MNSIIKLVDASDPIRIIDIGASLVAEQAPRYQPLIDAGLAQLIAFEPDQEAIAALRIKYPPPHKCLPYFVGSGHPATFFETNWGPTGSLFEPNTTLLKRFHNLAEVVTLVGKHAVQTVRLDDIEEISDIDFIKIDAQGAEKMIFENAPSVLSNTMLIQTEVSWVELYKGMPLCADIDRVLRSAGFQWHTRLGSGYRPFLPFLNPDHPHAAFNQELWSDVVYVRDWMHFDHIAPGKLVKLAVLLHEIYGSFDLAYVALEAADRQGGTNLRLDYSEQLCQSNDGDEL